MASNYVCFEFSFEEAFKELLISYLDGLQFEAMEELDSGLKAYLAEDKQDNALIEELEKLPILFPISWKVHKVENKNWNAIWESNFKGIQVGQFCFVRPPFVVRNTEVQHDIIIYPKMAFGTGHHETTYMMIEMMSSLNFTEKIILDFGCGTGILALLASKLGATKIDAIDIEQPATDNTNENASLNQISNINVILGDLLSVELQKYDGILANINRNVILNTLSSLYAQLRSEGFLLISGILNQDESLVLAKAEETGFKFKLSLRKGEWSCMYLLKV